MSDNITWRENDPARPRVLSPYPGSEAEWRERYDVLWNAYLLGEYSTHDAKAYHLFRALDDSGNEIDFVRRLFQFFRFITDTDVSGFLGSAGLTLEVKGKQAELLATGEGIWKRSKLDVEIVLWARMVAALGDYWVESVRMPGGRVEIVGYDPRLVTSVYDTETGRKLQKVIVELSYLDEPMRDAGDALLEDAAHTYRREIDATSVAVYRDNKLVEKKPHRAGVVPLVHLRWKAWDQPEHSLPAAHGVDEAVMRLDSFVTQVGAVANRYGNPTMVVKGAKLGDGSNVGLFGRVLSGLPADGDVSYLEAGATAVEPILEVMREVIAHVRETAPEFLFADAGAQESGEARSYRASAFEAKVLEARKGNFAALAEITGIAAAMERGDSFDPEAPGFTIDASPVLPRNLATELEVLDKAAKWLTRADITRRLQALGIVSNEHDPEEYSREVDDETAARAQSMFADPAAGGKPGAAAGGSSGVV